MQRSRFGLALVAVFTFCALLVAWLRMAPKFTGSSAAPLFSQAELAWLANPAGPPAPDLRTPGLVWVRAYRSGQLIFHRWWNRASVEQALNEARSAVQPGDLWWEVGQALDAVPVRRATPDRTGLLGYAVEADSGTIHVAPQDLVRQGMTPQDMVARLRLSHTLAHTTIFNTRVALIHGAGPARQLMRSSPYLPPSVVSADSAARFTEDMAGYLFRGTAREGGLVPYQINPPDGALNEEKMLFVRLFLGCWGMVRWSRSHPDLQPEARQLCERLLARFGHRWSNFTWLEAGRDRGLGSLAFMTLSLDALPHPDSASRSESERLLAALLHLQQPAGWFVTQWSRRPQVGALPDAEHDANQNFYAPEAMLCLAQRYLDQREPRCRQAFHRAWSFYREWFWKHPSPAFVPWFVQASAVMVRAGEERYASDALALEDWHLNHLQPYSEVALPDLRGGLIAPGVSAYGKVSYASSCGVHMEGLSEAWWLADHLHDPVRRERYRAALCESMRYMMQLQYRGPDDSYWMAPAAAARFSGGVRSTPNTGEVQVDNVAHTLGAMTNVLNRLPANDLHAP